MLFLTVVRHYNKLARGCLWLSRLTETTQINFTTAHELGHFENEKIKFKACKDEDVIGIISKPLD
jgi:Zn-dependent peptidase ImmA (M78 family)